MSSWRRWLYASTLVTRRRCSGLGLALWGGTELGGVSSAGSRLLFGLCRGDCTLNGMDP